MGGSSKFIHASFPLVDVRCVVHVFVCLFVQSFSLIRRSSPMVFMFSSCRKDQKRSDEAAMNIAEWPVGKFQPVRRK